MVLDEGMGSDLWSGVYLTGLDEGMGSDLWSGVYLTGLEWFWMKECVLISGQVFIWWVWSGSG